MKKPILALALLSIVGCSYGSSFPKDVNYDSMGIDLIRLCQKYGYDVRMGYIYGEGRILHMQCFIGDNVDGQQALFEEMSSAPKDGTALVLIVGDKAVSGHWSAEQNTWVDADTLQELPADPEMWRVK